MEVAFSIATNPRPEIVPQHDGDRPLTEAGMSPGQQQRKRKIRRNESCPCGSGAKYKRCCGAPIHTGREYIERYGRLPPIVEKQFVEHLARQHRQEALFGHAPIVSTMMNGYRVVGVGTRVHWSKKWKTFHDFLIDWVRGFIGATWGQAELEKPFEHRHPFVQWYDGVCRLQTKTVVTPGQVVSTTSTGPVAAFLGLAWDLFVLEHNVRVRDALVRRLQHADQFQGALYEVHVAASLVRAGFEVELEDEADSNSTHCELTAIHRTGARYSVEAKSKHRAGILGRPGDALVRDDLKLQVGRLLRKALEKDAKHSRIVFIDVNMPPDPRGQGMPSWMDELIEAVDSEERNSREGANLPECWLFLTNRPNHYVGAAEPNPPGQIVMSGFNKPQFRARTNPADFSSDPPIGDLANSLFLHRGVPHEFE